jgi:uncharacterized membrane protein YhaH (DUF805 family)
MFERVQNLLLGFGGRISRKSFWFGVGLMFLIIIVTQIIGILLDFFLHTTKFPVNSIFAGAGPVQVFLAVASWYPQFAIAVKRLHDRNKSARWLILLFVPIVGALWMLVELGFLRGTRGINKWGDDPTGKVIATVF